jgi:uncharacterized repeat protein (TIGR02543 family)
MKTKNFLMSMSRRGLLMLAILTMISTNVWGGTYEYILNSAASSSGGANVNYWYSNAGCTTSLKTYNSGDNVISESTTPVTIYYQKSPITSTAFSVAASSTSWKVYFMQGNPTALLLGKNGAYITLPTYSGEKITNVTVVTGTGCSTSVTFNIYSGDNAASDAITGAASKSCSFDISSTYQSDALKIKVTNAYNLQIATITITTASSNYTVTYNANGATSGTAPTDASSPYAPSSTVTVKANTGSLARTGCTFSGWSTEADGSGTDYAASGSATFTITGNTTLYAKWAATVTWNDNGGVIRTDNIFVPAAGKSVTPPSDPSTSARGNCGDKFMGWTTTENYKSDSPSPGDIVTGAQTVTGSADYYAVFADYAE